MFARPLRKNRLRIQDIKAYFAKHDQIKDYKVHSSKVHSVGWNCDGTKLASGSFDKTVSVFNMERTRLNKEVSLKGHEASVDQLAWHGSDPSLLATASCDRTVRVWDVRSQRPAATVHTKGENINIAWAPDGKTIAVGNKDDLITFIDSNKYSISFSKQFSFEVNEITFGQGSDVLLVTTGSGSIQVYSLPDMNLQHSLKAHSSTCICIKMDPTGKVFGVGAADAVVSLWDCEKLTCSVTLSRLEWPVRTLSFSHDGQLVASASEDLLIDIADVATGQQVTKVPVDTPTFTVAFHPKCYLLAFACDDKDSQDQRKASVGVLKLFGVQKSTSSH